VVASAGSPTLRGSSSGGAALSPLVPQQPQKQQLVLAASATSLTQLTVYATAVLGRLRCSEPGCRRVFHLASSVGLEDIPGGAWLCPFCRSMMEY
jgi:hypothetical protein